jgi:hypothetical protein
MYTLCTKSVCVCLLGCVAVGEWGVSAVGLFGRSNRDGILHRRLVGTGEKELFGAARAPAVLVQLSLHTTHVRIGDIRQERAPFFQRQSQLRPRSTLFPRGLIQFQIQRHLTLHGPIEGDGQTHGATRMIAENHGMLSNVQGCERHVLLGRQCSVAATATTAAASATGDRNRTAVGGRCVRVFVRRHGIVQIDRYKGVRCAKDRKGGPMYRL